MIAQDDNHVPTRRCCCRRSCWTVIGIVVVLMTAVATVFASMDTTIQDVFPSFHDAHTEQRARSHIMALLVDNPVASLHFDNATLTRIQSKRDAAEQQWRNQGDAYLWMQHSRKSGGTTLCMTLRLNHYGLIQLDNPKQFVAPKRETCQICSFCCDCNVKDKAPNSKTLEATIRHTMQQHGRNFFEVEGSGIPSDVLSSNVWDSWVFVSTIRHPLDRIMSAFMNDPPFDCAEQVNTGTTTRACVNQLVNEEAIQARCRHSVYHCHSNYYVRILSGLDTEYSSDGDMLDRAKRNFMRFSCVVLLEQWQDTVTCLSTQLGLNLLHTPMEFNVDGVKEKNDIKIGYHDEKEAQVWSPENLATMTRLNHVDLEFFDWAKEFILASIDDEFST